MAVAFAIGRNMRQAGVLVPLAAGVAVQAAEDALAKLLTGVQQTFKGNGPR